MFTADALARWWVTAQRLVQVENTWRGIVRSAHRKVAKITMTTCILDIFFLSVSRYFIMRCGGGGTVVTMMRRNSRACHYFPPKVATLTWQAA